MGRFKDKVAIVTGASGGIGSATALLLARNGASVVLTGRDGERLGKTAKCCKEAGAEVLEVVCDLRKLENLEMLITKAVERFSRIDILVNNAGHAVVSTTEDSALEGYEATFETIVRATVFLCKFAAPHLKKTKGCIVNVSSQAAITAFPAITTYAMAKCAVDHFTKGFAAEMDAFGVRVNSINPATVETQRSPVELPDTVRKMRENFLKLQPFGMISQEEIAEGILYLCTASHVTGTLLVIDGGSLLGK